MILLLLACSSGSLSISPNPIEWGEIDFHNADPMDCDPEDGGCDPTVVTLLNDGDRDVGISIPGGVDSDHLCVDGFEPDTDMDLGTLGAGSSYNLVIAVCGYEPGERDSEVTGAISIALDSGDTESLEWSFTPIRNIGGSDSGS